VKLLLQPGRRAIKLTIMGPLRQAARINEVARLRTENRLLKSIKEGKVCLDTSKGKKYRGGHLGTWARRFLQYFTLKQEGCWTLINKLRSDGDADDRRYVVEFFWDSLPKVVTEEWEENTIVGVISGAVRDGDSDVRGKLIDSIRWGRFPEEWQKKFAENLKDLTDPDNPATYLPDGTPFLKGEGEEVEPTDIHF
jgi:hypothetical protein